MSKKTDLVIVPAWKHCAPGLGQIGWAAGLPAAIRLTMASQDGLLPQNPSAFQAHHMVAPKFLGRSPSKPVLAKSS